MKNLDNLYEAYQNYKKLCVVDNDTDRFLRAYMANKNRESEDIFTVFSVCHIEQDWVEAIETGLPFIEKAIKEERQFIRNDGEVLPIEKIRKTSKDSIQDLAKHANYITHEAPEDLETEVLPDKMLMIQKESDFAIYENRVLYAALMYLKDFVASRLVEIKETTNTYLVKQHINKMIDMGSRKIKIDLKYDESRVNDPLLTDKNKEKDVIDRLDEILTGILALLKTPLMREVSKAEMVSRPIAKTNILKMNRNFRESLACFEYIANYQGKGFTIEHIEKSLIPYSKIMNEAYTENLIMLSFLNYMFANNISQELKTDYEEILRKREIQKENEILAKLREFRATAETKEQTVNEYLIMFEQGYRIIEERNDELNVKVKENEARRVKELKEMQEQHDSFVNKLNDAHAEEVENINKQNEEKLAALETAKEEEIKTIKDEAAQEINAAKQASANELTEYKNQFNEHIAQMEQENADIKAQFAAQNEKIASLEADLLNRRVSNGETNAKEFALETDFDKLEQLKKDFDAFFNKAWKEAKKQIRKDILLKKPEKEKKKKRGEEETYEAPTFEESSSEQVVAPAQNKEMVQEEPKEQLFDYPKEEEALNESEKPSWIKEEAQEDRVEEQSFDAPEVEEKEEIEEEPHWIKNAEPVEQPVEQPSLESSNEEDTSDEQNDEDDAVEESQTTKEEQEIDEDDENYQPRWIREEVSEEEEPKEDDNE